MISERDTDWLPLAHPHLGTWPTTQACALIGNRTSDPLVHRPTLNPLNHTSQGMMLFVFEIFTKIKNLSFFLFEIDTVTLGSINMNVFAM